jgi:choice-of-anchor A domain-containing protein
MTLRSDVGGRVAVGGNATFTNFAVGSGDGGARGTALSSDAGRVDLVVGGKATLSGGSINKGSAQAGSAQVSNVGFQTSGAGMQVGTTSVDFASAFDLATGSSELLRGMSATGTSALQWGGLTLTGSDATLNVFDIDASQLTGIHSLNITVPTTSTVLFNVRGSSLTIPSLGMSVNGRQDNTMASRLLLNFYELTSLQLSGLAWQGTILAPAATMSFGGGNVNGQVIVNNLYSNGGAGYANIAFDGSLPALAGDSSPAAVPEPSSLVLLSAAMLVVAHHLRRRA